MRRERMAKIYSRKQIINDVPPDCSAVLIGISTPDGNYEDFPNHDGWHAVHEFQFEDFEHDFTAKSDGKRQYKVITSHQAKEMILIMSMHWGRDFYIFCDGGISRSMAVGCFMADFLEYELELNAYKNTHSMNKLVYSKLGENFSTEFRTTFKKKRK